MPRIAADFKQAGQRRRTALALALAPALALPLLACAPRTALSDEAVYRSEEHDFRLVTLVEGLDHPWSLAFLPDMSMLVTEKSGALRVIRGGKLDPRPVGGVPESAERGQGGLLDVVPHPDFVNNAWLYLSYAARGDDGYGTRVSRGRFDGERLSAVETIFEARPLSGGGRHFGSRLAFDTEGFLYVTVGDRGERDLAQDLKAHNGKVVRLRDDGGLPEDNPFMTWPNALPDVFSLGHRNPQGLTVEPATGWIWAVEHGPRGGDELNRIEAGVNYGWPVITHGREYIGGSIGEGTSKPGMRQPVAYWVPSISPSGMDFYEGDAFPDWRGDLFVGALSGTHLARISLERGTVVGQERLLVEFDERIRDVRTGPDGLLYILTDDNDGGLYRLEPVG